MRQIWPFKARFDPIFGPPGPKIQIYPRFPENPKDFLDPRKSAGFSGNPEKFRQKFF